MLEYLCTALAIFAPLAWAGFKWLRKIGLETKVVWFLLSAALVLVVVFPLLASKLHPIAFAVFNAGVFAGAGWLIWNKREAQGPAVSGLSGLDPRVENHAATDEEYVVEEAEAVIGTNTSTVGKAQERDEEYLFPIQAHPNEIGEEFSTVPNLEAAAKETSHEAGAEGLEAERAVEAEADVGSQSAVEIWEESAEIAVEEEQETPELVEPVILSELSIIPEPQELQIADGGGDRMSESIEYSPAEEPGDTLVTSNSTTVEEPLEESLSDIEGLIDKGFEAKFEGDYARAAGYFYEAWKAATDPELFYLLGTELATLFRELGDYDRALEVLEILAENPAIDREKAETAAREKKLLEITKRLLEEIGMSGLPASQIPRFIRHKAWLELESDYLK